MNTNTEKTVKITKAMRFAEIREMIPADRTDLLDFIDHEVSLLSRKNRADRKPTANEIATNEARENLYENLVAHGAPLTVSEIMATFSDFSTMSNQKITALLRGLVNAGRVVKTIEKRKSYFAAVVA